MASAPRPGAKKQQAVQSATWRVTVRGRTLEVPVAMEMREKFMVRAATGYPLEHFIRLQAEDTVMVLWFLARRHNGESRLSFEQAVQEWEPLLSTDDFELTMVEDDGEPSDDPGKSVPA